MSNTRPRLAIKGKWVLVPHGETSRIEADRWVVVDGDRIAAVTPERPEHADEVIEVGEGLVLPGFLNMHNHISSAVLTRGLTEDLATQSYATELIYDILLPTSKVAVETLTDNEMLAVADLGLLEIIKGGTTTLLDGFRAQQVQFFESAANLGLRFYGAPYLFSGTPDDPLTLWKDLYQTYNDRAQERIKVFLGPHGVDTCDIELFLAVKETAQEYGCLVTTHVAQSLQEVEQIRRTHGCSPVAHLASIGLLGPNLLAAHCLYADEDDLELLCESDTVVANCPMTFARGGLYAPYQRFAGHGIRTVLGTDGYIMDVANEMRMSGLISKLESGRASVGTAAELVDAMTLMSADVLGRSDLGRIQTGAKADIVVVDLKAAHFQPINDPLTAFVWYGSGADITHVFVDGRALVRERRYTLADEEAIIEAGAAAVSKVWTACREQGIRRYQEGAYQ